MNTKSLSEVRDSMTYQRLTGDFWFHAGKVAAFRSLGMEDKAAESEKASDACLMERSRFVEQEMGWEVGSVKPVEVA